MQWTGLYWRMRQKVQTQINVKEVFRIQAGGDMESILAEGLELFFTAHTRS